MLEKIFTNRPPAHIDTSKVKLGKRVNLKRARLAAEGLNVIADDTRVKGSLSLGLASIIGVKCTLHGTISVGRYSQIAQLTGIYSRNHPFGHLANFMTRTLFEGRLKQGSRDEKVEIGNDVWLAHGVIVLSGVTIGDGAVVGAGAVVTRSVAPYTIAVGNPAREQRKRFPEQIIELIRELRWWELTPEELKPIEPLFHLDLAGDPDAAERELKEAIAWRRGER